MLDKEIISLCKSHKSCRKVSYLIGIDIKTIQNILINHNMSLNPATWKFDCNHNFFSSNFPESFYWAGFIAADGCVKLDSGHKYLSIGLENKDNVHVKKFKSAVEFEGPIHTVQRIDCVSSEICIRSDKLFDDLVRFNVIQRKSLVLTFSEWLINHPDVNHFMRGYFDGDGSFYVPKSKNGRAVNQLYFSLRGTKEFLEVYSQILSKQCDIDYKKPRPNSGIYTLEYGGNKKVIKIRDFLYKNSTNEIRLDRKYDLAFSTQFVDLPEHYNYSPVISTSLETGQEVSFESIKAAVALGFTGPSITACCGGKYKSHKGYTWKYV